MKGRFGFPIPSAFVDNGLRGADLRLRLVDFLLQQDSHFLLPGLAAVGVRDPQFRMDVGHRFGDRYLYPRGNHIQAIGPIREPLRRRVGVDCAKFLVSLHVGVAILHDLPVEFPGAAPKVLVVVLADLVCLIDELANLGLLSADFLHAQCQLLDELLFPLLHDDLCVLQFLRPGAVVVERPRPEKAAKFVRQQNDASQIQKRRDEHVELGERAVAVHDVAEALVGRIRPPGRQQARSEQENQEAQEDSQIAQSPLGRIVDIFGRDRQRLVAVAAGLVPALQGAVGAGEHIDVAAPGVISSFCSILRASKTLWKTAMIEKACESRLWLAPSRLVEPSWWDRNPPANWTL